MSLLTGTSRPHEVCSGAQGHSLLDGSSAACPAAARHKQSPYTPCTAPAPPRPRPSLPPLSPPVVQPAELRLPSGAGGRSRPLPAATSLFPLSPRSPRAAPHANRSRHQEVKPSGCEPTAAGPASFPRRLPPSPGRRGSNAAPRTHSRPGPAPPPPGQPARRPAGHRGVHSLPRNFRTGKVSVFARHPAGRQRPAAGEAAPASPTGVQRAGAGGCPAEPPPCPLPGTAGWGQGAFRAACLPFCLPEEVPLPPDLPGRTGWGLKGYRAFFYLFFFC